MLFSPTLRCLRAAWPQTRIAVVIRQPYLELAPLLVPGIEWLPTSIDPFVQKPGECGPELSRLRSVAAELAPELVVAACPRRNWLEPALAIGCAQARRLALGPLDDDPFHAQQLRLFLGTSSVQAFHETVAYSAHAQDWQRNYCLAEHLLGRVVDRAPPALEVDAAMLQAADTRLRELGLEPGNFAVCAAAGFANVRIKTWPADRFAATLRWLRKEHQLPALLVGHESERAYLEDVRAAAAGPAGTGTSAPALWLGGEDGLPMLAALLARSTLYLGNDTGAMHLAAALDRPVVAIFGGGTWPRFQPAARQAVSLVHPLPCFGCGWDCPFGDAPCIQLIGVTEVQQAIADLRRRHDAPESEVRALRSLPDAALAIMGKTFTLAREREVAHLARQQQFEETVALADERLSEIAALKRTCDEREALINKHHGWASDFRKTIAELEASLRVHKERNSSNRDTLAIHRHYQHLLREKEDVLQALHRACQEREALIREMAMESTAPTAWLRKIGLAAAGWWRARIAEPARESLYRRLLDGYWMQLGTLRQYEPRPIRWDPRLRRIQVSGASVPRIGLVTPSYNQATFIESTLRSVLEQKYPKLLYTVQDGASTDDSLAISERFRPQLHSLDSAPDAGQADAIAKGFARLAGELEPDDIMGWLNSDDLLAPRALPLVGRFFAAHPKVDVVYGHRLIIDAHDREVGRWILPRHDRETLRWIDFVPQETLFWRKRAWDRIGGIDPSFHFALDWDLVVRLQETGLRIVRLPYFLGAFRVHDEQKTSAQIHAQGQDEMNRVRSRLHGASPDHARLDDITRRAQLRGAVTARLLEMCIRW